MSIGIIQNSIWSGSTMVPYYYIDLDGVLTKLSPRRAELLGLTGHLKLKDIKTFHDAFHEDEPNGRIIKYLDDARRETKARCVVLTGTPDEYKVSRRAYIMSHIPFHCDLIMRPAGNFRSAQEFKRMVMQAFHPIPKGVVLYDDHKETIDEIIKFGFGGVHVDEEFMRRI